MPNVMAALPNIGGALCSSRKVWLTPTTKVPCNNAAKTGNPLKFDGVPLTPEPIAAVSGLKFTILCEPVDEILLLNKFFPIVDTCLSCEDIHDKVVRCCTDGHFCVILSPVFPVNRMQHISDRHSKFALRPHHVWKYGRHPMCGR